MTIERTGFALALGANLKTARGERSFIDISEASGGYVHPRMVQNYEDGTEPRLSTFLVLAAALGVAPTDLIPPSVVAASEARSPAELVRIICADSVRVPSVDRRSDKPTMVKDDAPDDDSLARELGLL